MRGGTQKLIPYVGRKGIFETWILNKLPAGCLYFRGSSQLFYRQIDTHNRCEHTKYGQDRPSHALNDKTLRGKSEFYAHPNDQINASSIK